MVFRLCIILYRLKIFVILLFLHDFNYLNGWLCKLLKGYSKVNGVLCPGKSVTRAGCPGSQLAGPVYSWTGCYCVKLTSVCVFCYRRNRKKEPRPGTRSNVSTWWVLFCCVGGQMTTLRSCIHLHSFLSFCRICFLQRRKENPFPLNHWESWSIPCCKAWVSIWDAAG